MLAYICRLLSIHLRIYNIPPYHLWFGLVVLDSCMGSLMKGIVTRGNPYRIPYGFVTSYTWSITSIQIGMCLTFDTWSPKNSPSGIFLKFNMNPETIYPWKRIFLLKSFFMFGFHVFFGGVHRIEVLTEEFDNPRPFCCPTLMIET